VKSDFPEMYLVSITVFHAKSQLNKTPSVHDANINSWLTDTTGLWKQTQHVIHVISVQYAVPLEC